MGGISVLREQSIWYTSGAINSLIKKPSNKIAVYLAHLILNNLYDEKAASFIGAYEHLFRLSLIHYH